MFTNINVNKIAEQSECSVELDCHVKSSGYLFEKIFQLFFCVANIENHEVFVLFEMKAAKIKGII